MNDNFVTEIDITHNDSLLI